MHRHHRAPGRRHQAHGRRILALRAHAEAGHRRRGRRRHRAPGGVPDAGRPSRHRFRGRIAGGDDAGALRPAADFAGADQHHQERDRGDRRGAGRPSSARGRIEVSAQRDGKDIVDRRDRQRHRPAEGKPRAPARALCDDAREGHRPWARHRRPHSRRAWRPHRTARRLGKDPGRARRLDAVALRGRGD